MSFKVHLLIISCIIIVVLLSWQFIQSMPAAPAPVASGKPSYNILVSHASWGLNCPAMAVNNDTTQRDAFLNKPATNNKLREDNVLGRVGLACNGTTKCEISPDEATLGPDPAPECTSKNLEIEYRCFSYDRPWTLKTTTSPVTLHCDQPAK